MSDLGRGGFDAIICVVGGKDDLSDETLANVLGQLNDTVKYTDGPIHLVVDGFDDDPRSLWDIPEVRSYIRRLIFGMDLGLTARLDHLSRILAAVCCGTIRPIGVNPVTGDTIFEQVRRE